MLSLAYAGDIIIEWFVWGGNLQKSNVDLQRYHFLFNTYLCYVMLCYNE